MHTDMICTNRDMFGRLCERLCDAKRAAPFERFHASVGKAPRPRRILAPCNARNLERRRMAEDFFLRTLRSHASVRQHNEFFANAVRLFEIMAHEQCRSAVARQRFAELALE